MKRVRYLIFSIIFLFLVMVLSMCKPEKEYIYEVETVNTEQDGTTKSHLKTNNEFISIAYQDLFGASISVSELNKLNIAYSSFGDRKLIEDMIIRNFLNDPGVKIPSKPEMKNDVNAFINNSYKKFYNRSPNAYEQWQLKNIINNDTTITPELIYYSLMTGDEYRYY